MNRRIRAFLLLIPHIWLTILFLAGLYAGITQSFGVIPAFGLKEPTLMYYREVLAKPEFLRSVLYSLRTSFLSAVIAAAAGVLICGLLVLQKKERGLAARILQLPILVPHVVAALFVMLLCSQNGLLARAAWSLGLIQSQSDFPLLLFDEKGYGVMIAYIWKETPFIVYFVLSLMANINSSLGEAARNLGASPWKAFWKVTLPLCRNAVLSGFLIIFVFSLGAYELPFILGATKPKALPVAAYLEYIHPDLRNRPYAMALNGVITLISLVCAALYYYLMLRKADELYDRKHD